jgi:transposase
MSNELSAYEQAMILRLLQRGWSVRCIARETGHSREAIKRYKNLSDQTASKPAGVVEVITDPSVSTASNLAAGSEVITDLTDAVLPTDDKPSSAVPDTVCARGRSTCEEHRVFIAEEHAKGRNSTAIYQDLVEHHGYAGSDQAVRRFARTIAPADPPYAKCRFETPPGQEAQVDYGEGAPTLDPHTGKYRKPRLFIMTLGYSRHSYRVVVPKSSQEVWCRLHEDAFTYFGGTPLTIRLDNLREGVIEPNIYDPELNPLYAAMLAHYGVVALPCRPYTPDLKGKVESAVDHTQKTALKGKRFKSIDEQNAHLLHWNERWAATRIHGTTKRQVREMFTDERPSLQALPSMRFEYYKVLERRVHLDAHIEVSGAYYSVPPRYMNRTVIVHAGQLWIRIIDAQNKQCIREHTVARKGSRRTNDDDRPKQTPRAVHDLVNGIAVSGPSCAAFARTLVEENGAIAARSLYGLLSCIRKYGAAEVERACGIAVRVGAFRLRFVLRMLSLNVAAPSQELTDKHPLIEAIATYRSHFTSITQGELP